MGLAAHQPEYRNLLNATLTAMSTHFMTLELLFRNIGRTNLTLKGDKLKKDAHWKRAGEREQRERGRKGRDRERQKGREQNNSAIARKAEMTQKLETNLKMK